MTKINLANLNAVLVDYQKYSRLTTQEVLNKQSTKLGYALRANLAAIRPAKGSIRQQALARLKAGQGISIRDSIREDVTAKVEKIPLGSRRRILKKGKSLAVRGRFVPASHTVEGILAAGIVRSAANTRLQVQQEMIRREINLREKGRGVLAKSAVYPGNMVAGATKKAYSVYGTVFSDFGITVTKTGGVAVFNWAGINKQSARAVRGLGGPRAVKATQDAIDFVEQDIREYVKKKQMELFQKSFAQLTGPFRKL